MAKEGKEKFVAAQVRVRPYEKAYKACELNHKSCSTKLTDTAIPDSKKKLIAAAYVCDTPHQFEFEVIKLQQKVTFFFFIVKFHIQVKNFSSEEISL